MFELFFPLCCRPVLSKRGSPRLFRGLSIGVALSLVACLDPGPWGPGRTLLTAAGVFNTIFFADYDVPDGVNAAAVPFELDAQPIVVHPLSERRALVVLRRRVTDAAGDAHLAILDVENARFLPGGVRLGRELGLPTRPAAHEGWLYLSFPWSGQLFRVRLPGDFGP